MQYRLLEIFQKDLVLDLLVSIGARTKDDTREIAIDLLQMFHFMFKRDRPETLLSAPSELAPVSSPGAGSAASPRSYAVFFPRYAALA